MSLRTPAKMIFKPSLGALRQPAIVVENNRTHMISEKTRIKCNFSKGLHAVTIRVENAWSSAALTHVDLTEQEEVSLLGFHIEYIAAIKNTDEIRALILWVQLDDRGIKE